MPFPSEELASVWRQDAPVGQFRDILADAEHSSERWPSVEAVEKVDSGEPSGRYSVGAPPGKRCCRTSCASSDASPDSKLRCCSRRRQGTMWGAGRGICRICPEDRQTVAYCGWNVRICRSLDDVAVTHRKPHLPVESPDGRSRAGRAWPHVRPASAARPRPNPPLRPFSISAADRGLGGLPLPDPPSGRR